VAQSAVVDIPIDWAPLTVAPDAGYVNDAVKLATEEAEVFDTVTVTLALPVLPEVSVTLAVNECCAFVALVVFQLNVGFVPV